MARLREDNTWLRLAIMAATIPFILMSDSILYRVIILTLVNEIVMYTYMYWSTDRLVKFLRHILHSMVFMHWIKYPKFIIGDIEDPRSLGLPDTYNLYMYTPDKCKLGMWHCHSLNSIHSKSDSEQVGVHAFLYLHGNGGSGRNQPHRVRLCSTLRQIYPDHHVFALDYRGFGDSTGTPTEDGLVLDAMTAYKFILEMFSEKNVHITVWGQSLGTGVATKLCRQISEDTTMSKSLKCLVLDVPFTDIVSGASTYHCLKYITMMLGKDFVQRLIKRMLGPDILFDTKTHIGYVRCPIVILHGKKDNIIPADNSIELYNSLLGDIDDSLKCYKPTARDINYTSFNSYQAFGKINNNSITLCMFPKGTHNDLNTFEHTHIFIKVVLNKND